MSPDELKLLALHELIEIEATTDVAAIQLIEKEYGPFQIGQVYDVPVHCAFKMCQFNFCKILLPNYLKVEKLIDLKQREKDSEEYQEIYPFIFELYDDILRYVTNKKEINTIKLLVSEIRDIRLKKTKNGLKSLDGKALCLNNLTVYEYQQIKPILLKGMEMAIRLENKTVEIEE